MSPNASPRWIISGQLWLGLKAFRLGPLANQWWLLLVHLTPRPRVIDLLDLTRTACMTAVGTKPFRLRKSVPAMKAWLQIGYVLEEGTPLAERLGVPKRKVFSKVRKPSTDRFALSIAIRRCILLSSSFVLHRTNSTFLVGSESRLLCRGLKDVAAVPATNRAVAYPRAHPLAILDSQ
jgi:hypothetical protein